MEVLVNINSSDSGWLAPATVAQILVAGTTLFLAIFTLRSVRAARSSADATVKLAEAAEKEVAAAHQQNELAERTLLANIQPVLADFPRKRSTDLDMRNEMLEVMRSMRIKGPPVVRDTNYLLEDWVPWANSEDERQSRLQSMHIWSDSMLAQAPEGVTAWGITTLFKNVGNGAAIVEDASLELAGKRAAYETRISKLLIARDDYCRVTFNVLANGFPDPLKSGGYGRNHAEPDFFVDISYSNVAGSGRQRTRQRIQIVRGNPYIAAIEIWDQETGIRLAVSEYFGHVNAD